MAGEGPKDEKNEREEPTIGFDNAVNPEVMIVTIPFKKWSQDNQYGEILINGAFEVFKRIAIQNVVIVRRRDSKSTGVIKPGNNGENFQVF